MTSQHNSSHGKAGRVHVVADELRGETLEDRAYKRAALLEELKIARARRRAIRAAFVNRASLADQVVDSDQP